jgi:hypothetical protein
MVFFIINKIEEQHDKKELLEKFFKMPFSLMDKSPNKTVQQGAA